MSLSEMAYRIVIFDYNSDPQPFKIPYLNKIYFKLLDCLVVFPSWTKLFQPLQAAISMH